MYLSELIYKSTKQPQRTMKDTNYQGSLRKLIEERSSMPNCLHSEEFRNIPQMITLHLQAKEYNKIKKIHSDILNRM